MKKDKTIELCKKLYELDRKLYDFVLKTHRELEHLIREQDNQIQDLTMQIKLKKRAICEEYGGHFFEKREDFFPGSFFDYSEECSICHYNKVHFNLNHALKEEEK